MIPGGVNQLFLLCVGKKQESTRFYKYPVVRARKKCRNEHTHLGLVPRLNISSPTRRQRRETTVTGYYDTYIHMRDEQESNISYATAVHNLCSCRRYLCGTVNGSTTNSSWISAEKDRRCVSNRHQRRAVDEQTAPTEPIYTHNTGTRERRGDILRQEKERQKK